MGDKKYDNLFKQKVNLTTLFFARPMMYSINTFGKPMISDIIKKHYEHGFVQLYLCDEDGTLVLVYDKIEMTEKMVDWEFFYDSVVKSKFFIEDVEYEENKFAFKIRFPRKWKEDFDKIISGKYSKVSEMYIKKFYPVDDNLLYHLHYKTEKVIDHYCKLFNVKEDIFTDCEIGPIIDTQKETIKLSKSIAV
jgi:hypothetical protein